MNILRLLVCGILLLLSFPVSAQSGPVFEAIVDASDIEVGQTFEVSFRLRNAEGKNFRPPAWDHAIQVAGGPSFEQSMGFINGRSYTQQGWRYLLEAKKAGTINIPPASVTVDGKVLSSPPLTLTIGATPTGTTTIPSGSGEVFIVSELSDKTAFDGQQVTWRILLYTLVGIDGIDLIEMPNFKGFYTLDKKRFDTRLRNQTIKGKKYAIRTLHESALFPQETGELTIGPAKIRVGIEQRGGFGGFFSSVPRVLETQPVKLTVKSLPTPLPEHFCGGVGRYTWEITADKDALTTDDALTLRLSVRGNGDAHRFTAPKLVLPAGLEAFDPKIVSEETYENEQEFVHEQTLEYAVLPKHPGDYTFLPQVTWFNPDSNRYLTYSAAQPFQLHVTAGANYQVPGTESVGSTDTAPSAGLWDRLRSFFQNGPGIKWLAVVAGAALVLFIFVFWRKKRRDTPLPPVETVAEIPQPVKLPKRSVEEILGPAKRHIINGGPPAAGYELILKAIQQFLSEKLDIAPALINREEISNRLLAKQIPPVTVQSLIALWDQCESAVYGGSQPDPDALNNILKTAEQFMQDLTT